MESNRYDNKTGLEKAAEWTVDFWTNAASLLGAIALTVGAILVSVDGDWTSRAVVWIFVGIALSLVGGIWGWTKEERITRLRKECNEMASKIDEFQTILETSSTDYYDLFENELQILAEDVLKLSDGERVSVYRHNGTTFLMLGRYSKDPVYNKKGRGIYPESEGCIAKAWRDNEMHEPCLPDPVSEADEYIEAVRAKWNIKKTTVRSFSMKSRCYSAFAIENEQRVREAVVVFESVRPNGLNHEDLRVALENGEGRRIANYLTKMRSMEPAPEYAKAEGF